MAQDKFFKEREPKLDGSHHNHAGKHSEWMGIQSSDAQIREYVLFDARRQLQFSHETGEDAQLADVRAALAEEIERTQPPIDS